MSLKVADRVKENTTTVGSGILNLVGNTDGFQRFTNVLASGDITYYCIEENNKFEVGIGTYVADTLTRDYILRSSSNGNKINLQGSGVVFITYPADKAVYKNQESQVIIGPSGLIFNDNSIQLTAAKSIDEFNYISGITVNNQSDIVYLSGIAVNAEETLDINYVSGIATYASGQAINNKASITTNSNDIVYLSGLVVAAEESDSISYVSGVANYSSGQSIQNQQQILATSGWAANTFSTINNVNYISGVAIYSSGKSIQNTNDIIYLSGLVINAEESNDLSYVSGIAVYTSGKIYNDTYLSGISVYSSGQSIENEIQINAVSGWANSSFLRENSNSFIYLSGLVVAAEESNDIAYVSGVSVYGSGLGLSNASNIVAISGIASYASGQAIYNTNSIANLATEINYVSGLAILAEESLDISYVSGVAAYASGKTISNTNDIVYLSGLVVAAEETSAINYVSGIATYSSGQSIANQASIGNLTSNLAYVSGLAVLAEESIDVTYISGIAVYASGKIYNDTYVSGIAVYASGRSIANEVSINNINMDIVYLSGIATNAEETLDINYVSGIAAYSSGRVINNENTIVATSGWANSTFATNIDLQYVSGIAVAAEESNDINYISGISVYVSGNALYNVLEDTSPQLGGNLDTNNYYISGVGNIIGGTGLFSSLKVNNIDVSVSGHTHTASDITNFNTAVSGLIPVKDIVAGTNISVTNVSGVYTVNDISTSTTSAASIVTTVFNKTGAAMPKMTAVYLDGGQGDLPTIQKALATSDATSAATYGLTYEAIDNMGTGRVVVLGALTGLNTDQFNPNSPHGNINGSILYLSPTISGALTTTKPYAPQHIVAIGTVVRTHQNEGVIEVRVQNGFELDELHNVAISGVTNGEFLQYNASSGLWLPSNSGYFNNLYLGANGLYFNDGTQQTTSGLPYGSGSLINRNTADIIYISGLVVAAEETTQINYVSGIAVYSSGLSVQNQSNIVAVSGLVPTISNSSDNRVLTSTGAGTGINAESNLTFDGTNLGIGTSSPADKVHISSTGNVSLRINSTTSNVAELTLYSGSNVGGLAQNSTSFFMSNLSSSGTIAISQVGAGNIISYTNGAERTRIAADGNVGIGSTSPTTLLHILGTGEGIHSGRVGGGRPHLRLQHANGTVASRTISANGNYVGQVSFEGYNGTSYMEHTGIFGIVNGTVTTSSIPTDLVFSAGSSGNTASNERMRITSAGSVGIGTTSPATRLHVAGTSSTFNGLLLTTTAAGGGAYASIEIGTYYPTWTVASPASLRFIDDNNFSTHITFRTKTSGSASNSDVERFRITSAGNTEIRANAGNVSSAFTYNENGGELVHYDETQTAATLLDQTSTQTRLLELINGSNLVLGLGGSNTTGSIVFVRAGYNEAMRIDSTGAAWMKTTRAWNDAVPTLNIGNDGDGRLQTRHIWGKAAGGTGTEHLWIQFGNSGYHVQVGNAGQNTNLYVGQDLAVGAYFSGGTAGILGSSGYIYGKRFYNIDAVSTDTGFGLYFNGSTDVGYAIYRQPGAWTSPFPDLRIGFHTGIQIGANATYNGVRFYTDYDMSSQVMSVNNASDGLGAANVYVNNSLQAGSSLRAPIFYDSNDTNYYLDPNGTSVLNRVNPIGWDTSGRNYSREWIELPNFTGLLSGNNGAYFYPNNGSYGSWRIAGTRGGWAGLEFDSTGAGQISLMMNSNFTGVHNNSYGWQWYWTGGAFYVSTATYGGGTILPVTLPGNNSSVKAWCRFNGTAASPISVTNGYNVTNITRLGTGSYQINLTTAISLSNYCAVASSTTVRTSVVGVNSSQIFVDTFSGTGPINANEVHVVAT